MPSEKPGRKTGAYSDPRVLGMVFLGFSSGLPFLLTLATLHIWLSEVGISTAVIGFFVLVTLPYTFKFLWGPILDTIPFPGLSRLFGHRKGWILGSQICLIICLIGLGTTDPGQNLIPTAIWAALTAWSSATQDSVIEAYRIESLTDDKTGPGASASVIGYRLGLLVSGAGALYLSSVFTWKTVYAFMACCVVVGIVTTLLSPEPVRPTCTQKSIRTFSLSHVLTTLTDFLKNRDVWGLILFIIFFKIGDTILTVMTGPFLLDLGFSKIQIAHVGKAFGIGSMMLGGGFGGVMIHRYTLEKTLVLYCFLQILSCGMFMMQSRLGNDIAFLYATIGIEHFTCGMGGVGFLTLLSRYCLGPLTASRFALLSSIASASRVLFSWAAGYCADAFSWFEFYSGSAIACIPALLWVLWWSRTSARTHIESLPLTVRTQS